MHSGRLSDRCASISLLYYYSWAKASRSCRSCSSGRLVEMISKSYCLSSSITLSGACVVTTGRNVLDGLDLVIEGDAAVVSDEARLRRVADRYASKYDPPFHFTVRDGAFYGEDGDGGAAVVYEVTPTKAFGFGKGESFSQTRWRF